MSLSTLEPGGASLAASLKPLFEPRHIAVIGASRTVGKHGNTVVRYLQRWNYAGKIFPVNPAGEEVEGLSCYRAIADLPEAPDCAFLVIPAAATVEAVKQCADLGVRSLVIASIGFAESGTENGRRRQTEIAEIARAHGMRVLGPNTNGYLNAHVGASLGYNTSHGEPGPAGGISFASHSGALFNSIARRLTVAGTPIGKFVSIGNEADVSLLDVTEYLIEDDATQVIGLLIEGLSDGPRLRQLAARAQERGKPIVALKLGRSQAGVAASHAHSSRLAGKARAYDALFDACGIAAVQSLEALTGGCTLLMRKPVKAMTGDRRLVSVATSGAAGTLSVDFAAARGIPLAGEADGSWPAPVKAALAAIPDISPVRNPIDTSALNGDRLRILPILRTLAAQGYDGPVAVYSHVGARPNQDIKTARALIERLAETPAPIVITAPGRLPDEVEALYAEAGLPLFHDMGACFDSLACYYAALPPLDADALAPPTAARPLPAETRSAITQILQRADRNGVLSEFDSSDILRRAGLPMVESRRVTSVSESLDAAAAIGFPLVLKAMPKGVAHKDKLGLVAVGIENEAALQEKFTTLSARAQQHGFAASELTFIIQPMVASRQELLAGVSWEPGLGHFLVFGLGGVYTELLDQVELLPMPLPRAAIRAKLAASIAGRMLRARDDKDQAFEQFIDTLDRLQSLVESFGEEIASIDINPVLLGAKGCVAVDGLIVRREAASNPEMHSQSAGDGPAAR